MPLPPESRPGQLLPASEPEIKIIEDDVTNRGLVHELAMLAGEDVGISVHISEADTLEGLRETLETQDIPVPDLVLLDLMFPGFSTQDTLDAVSEIRKNERTKNIIIIGISGVQDEHIQERAIASGMDDYITKPFDSNKVIDKIKEILAQRPARAAQRSEHG